MTLFSATKNMKYLIHISILLIVTLACFSGANAQSKKRDAAAIKFAQATLVSNIEKGMPKMRFDSWFRQTVGPNMKITWEVNDCGEQTGTPADRGRDFPMCVEAMADSLDVHVSVALGVGTFKRGIIGIKPDMRGVGFSIEGEGNVEVKKLSDLSDALSSNGVDH